MLEPIFERYNGVTVLRDDLLPGGSKSRFLPYLIKGAKEVVFGGPFCGGAPLCLAVLGKSLGIKITLFYAKRKVLHRNQKVALEHGATIYQVPYGYMTNVQSKARRYAQDHGALFLPLGFDVPQASDPFINDMKEINKRKGPFDEVWVACGSGMLARCLAYGFPEAKIKAVVVGLNSRNQKQSFPDNVELIDCKYRFDQDCKSKPPFVSSENYDAKAWEVLMETKKGGIHNNILFWNVL